MPARRRLTEEVGPLSRPIHAQKLSRVSLRGVARFQKCYQKSNCESCGTPLRNGYTSGAELRSGHRLALILQNRQFDGGTS